MLFSLLIVYHAWRLFSVNSKIADSVKERLEHELQDQLSIQQVSLDWGVLRLRDITFIPPSHAVELWVENIDLAFDWKSFFSGGFQLSKIDQVTLINKPRITICHSPSRQDSVSLTEMDPSKTLEPILQSISTYSHYIRFIEIANGELFRKNLDSGESQRLLEGINGSAQALPTGKAQASLAGNFDNSKQYVVLHASLDYQENRLDSLVVTLPAYRANREMLSADLPYIMFEDGVASGEIRIFQNDAKNGLSVHGDLAFTEGRLRLRNENIVFDQVNVHANIEDENIRFSESSFLLNGSPTQLNGSVSGLLQPGIDIQISSQAFDLKKFVSTFSPASHMPISGNGQLKIALSGDLRNPVFEGDFVAPSLRLASQELTDLHVDLDFRDAKCTVREFVAKNFDSAVQGWGSLQFGDKQDLVSGTFVAEGDFTKSLQALFQFDMPITTGTALTEIKGSLQAPLVNGKFAFDLEGPNKKKLDLRGNFDVEKWNLTFQSKAANDDFAVNGIVDGINSSMVYSLNIENLTSLGGVFDMPVISTLSSRYRLDARLDGIAAQVQLHLLGYSRKADAGGVPEFSSTFTVKDFESRQKQIEGTLSIYPALTNWFSTSFSAAYSDSFLVFHRLGNERWLDGNLKIELFDERAIVGDIKFQNVEIERLVSKNDKGVPKMSGRGFGEIKLAGTLENPNVQINSWILDGYLNGIGVFKADASLSLEDDVLRLIRFDLKKNDQNYLQGKDELQVSTRMADFRLNGQNLDINSIIYVITGKDSVLTGKANVALQFWGDSWPIPVYGLIEIKNGKTVWFNFDELTFDMGVPGESEHVSHLGGEGLYVKRVSYLRGDDFIAQGDGTFPFNKQDDMRVHLKGTGNFLSLLSDVAPIVTQTSGIGQIDLNLVGPYQKVKLLDSKIQIFDGVINMPPIAKEIKDITAEIITEGEFINIQSGQGTIEKSPFTIRNYREIETENGREAEPLIINFDWMNLGIVELETESPGLPLHIPTIMENGEVGRFWLKGQEIKPSEQAGQQKLEPFKSQYGFTISGPWNHPLFRGEVVLNYTDVTYPFLETDEPPSPIIMNLLMNAEWDVRAIAGKDNNYVRNINYGISNVYVNIGIDDQVSRLHFTGIALDTSRYTPGVVELSVAPNEFRAQNGNGAIDSAAVEKQQAMKLPISYINKELKDAAGPDTSSFRIDGSITSTRGNIEYFDLIFRVDQFGATWDRSQLQPVLYGKAWATVPDSLNYSRDVYLKLYAQDPTTGAKSNRGRMEDIYFDLESDYQIEFLAYDQSRVQLLDVLGISLNDVRGQATELLTSSTDKVLFQQFVRPIERQLEKSLGLDIVRLNSRFTRNFLEINQGRVQSEATLALFRSTKLTIGKYLSSRMYLLYTGQVAAWPINYGYTDPNIGLRHTFGFEYRINPTLLLQMEYDYNSTLAEQWKEDKRIWLRHSFPF